MFASTLAKTKRKGLKSQQELFQVVTMALVIKPASKKDLQTDYNIFISGFPEKQTV